MEYDTKGLEALLFTSEGDMRHAINNLQATHAGFGHVSQEAVFKVSVAWRAAGVSTLTPSHPAGLRPASPG